MESLDDFLQHIDRIKIEVTNACNAKCIFCAYNKMTRQKMVISDALYQSAVNQISEIGCSDLMMSPVVGDPLLDKKFPWRLQYAKNLSGIGRIRFFTNLIGMTNFNDRELYLILDNTDTIIVSIAPNRKMYLELFGVDQFENVVISLVRISSIWRTLKNKPYVVFEGRAKEDFDIDRSLQKALSLFKANSHATWTADYKDWGGTLHTHSISVQRGNRSGIRTIPCERALVPVIYSDGKVGLCACADYDQKMVIGDIKKEKLQNILVSEKRKKYVQSFIDGNIPEFCAKCTFYVPHPRPLDTWMSAPNSQSI